MTKQEAIKQAYGEHWDVVKDYVDKNGWVGQYSAPIDISKLIECDLSDIGYYWRPISLQGIEDNNGWIKIESEKDLPKDNIECHFIIKENNKVTQIGRYHVGAKSFNVGTIWFNEVAHYQPIAKPKPPIY